MAGLEDGWRYLLVGLVAATAGIGLGAVLGASNSDPSETVVKTVTGGRRTVTETETVTDTVAKTEAESETSEQPTPRVDGADGADDDDGDGCSDAYVGPCVDPADGTNEVNCTEVGDTDFNSVAADPYGLDPDGDGLACES